MSESMTAQPGNRGFTFADLAHEQADKLGLIGQAGNPAPEVPTTSPPGDAGIPGAAEQPGALVPNAGLPGGVPEGWGMAPGDVGVAGTAQGEGLPGDLGDAFKTLEKMIPPEDGEVSSGQEESFFESPVPVEQMSPVEQERYKNMQRAFTQKTTEIKDQRREIKRQQEELNQKLADVDRTVVSLQQMQQQPQPVYQPQQRQYVPGGSDNDWAEISRVTGVPITDMTTEETKSVAGAMYNRAIVDNQRQQQAFWQQQQMGRLQNEFDRFADKRNLVGDVRNEAMTMIFSAYPNMGPGATMESTYDAVQRAAGVKPNQTAGDFVSSVQSSPYYPKIQRAVLEDLRAKARANQSVSPATPAASSSVPGFAPVPVPAPADRGGAPVVNMVDAQDEAQRRWSARFPFFGRK